MEENKRRTRVLNDIFGDYERSSKEFLFYCPKCKHHKRKLSVNLKKNMFKCWVCDYAGRNIDRLVRRYGGIRDQREWLSYRPKIDLTEFDKILLEVTEAEEKYDVSLPEEFETLTGGRKEIAALMAKKYLKKRGLTKRDLLRWKMGYCSKGKYKGRIIIPSFDLEGNTNYFISRSYDGGWRKYMNPSIPKNRIIFNELYLDFDSDLVITEGIFDAIRAGTNSVPLLGSTLSERSKLFWEIVKHDTPVYLCLDRDAKRKEIRIMEVLLKYDVEVYRINSEGYEDLAEIPKEVFQKKKAEAEAVDAEKCLLYRAEMIC